MDWQIWITKNYIVKRNFILHNKIFLSSLKLYKEKKEERKICFINQCVILTF